MGVKEIITGNTALVEQATSLLSTLDERDGAYIWEKYSYTLPASDIYALSGSDGRIIYYADAYTLSDGTYALVNPKSISIWASDTSPVVKLTGKYFLVAATSGTMMYRGMDNITTVLSGSDLYLRNVHVISNITEDVLTEIGYAVGDEEDSYPDGGELDGYWYKVKSEGVSGIDYGEVTVGSATSIVVEHNLGVNPRMVALIGNGNQNTGSASTIIIYPAYAYDGIAKSLVTQTYSGSRSEVGINMGNVGDTTKGAVVNEQSISFYASYSSNMYPFRGSYTWVAIA